MPTRHTHKRNRTAYTNRTQIGRHTSKEIGLPTHEAPTRESEHTHNTHNDTYTIAQTHLRAWRDTCWCWARATQAALHSTTVYTPCIPLEVAATTTAKAMAGMVYLAHRTTSFDLYRHVSGVGYRSFPCCVSSRIACRYRSRPILC